MGNHCSIDIHGSFTTAQNLIEFKFRKILCFCKQNKTEIGILVDSSSISELRKALAGEYMLAISQS